MFEGSFGIPVCMEPLPEGDVLGRAQAAVLVLVMEMCPAPSLAPISWTRKGNCVCVCLCVCQGKRMQADN